MKAALADLAARTDLALQWIPAHCGIKENEQADMLARGRGQLDQEDKCTPFTPMKRPSSKPLMKAATPKLQPVRQLQQTEQTTAGCSLQDENWAQQT